MAFGRKKPEPTPPTGPALSYCPKCCQKRFIGGGTCLTCGHKVPVPKNG